MYLYVVLSIRISYIWFLHPELLQSKLQPEIWFLKQVTEILEAKQ